MASKRIQGITIEIGGDTSKLQSALKGVDTELRKTQGNLKDINKLLKLDPGNTELLVQKQKNLQESIKATEERLKTLKATQTESLSPQEYDALQREIIDTEQRLGSLEDEYKAFGSVAQQKIYAAGEAMQSLGKRITEGIAPAEEALKKFARGVNDHVIQPIINVGKIAAGAGTAVTTALTKSAVEAKAEYEQLTGGVETLFKKSSKAVLKNARNAYKTSGKSANDYMKTVTGFSASLLQSLGGNTEKAARMADMAIQDMSDNANKFGSDMSSIEAAYAGFSKQQYTLLDNLKLGYGGTKTEMERLIRDAEKLDGTFKVHHETVKKGKTVNDELTYSYADIVQAIHIVQDNMGVTGTTAREAATTIEGSLATVKAAWENLMTAIGTGESVQTATRDLLESAGTYLSDNLLPTIRKALPGVGSAMSEITTKVLEGLPNVLWQTTKWIKENFPKIVTEVKNQLPLLYTAVDKAITDTLFLISESLRGIFDYSWLDSNNILLDLYKAKDDILGAIKTVGDALGRLWNETLKPYLGEKIKSFITKTLPTLTDTIGDIAEGIAGLIDWFNELDPGIKNTILDIAGLLLAAVPVISTVGKILTKGGDLVKLLSDPKNGIIALIALVATTIIKHWDEIEPWLKKAGDTIKTWVATVKEKWSNLMTAISQGIENAKEWFKTFGEKIKEVWDTHFQPVVDWLGEKFNGAINAIQPALEGIITFIRDVFAGDWESVWNTLVNLVSTPFNMLGEILKAPINAVIDLLNKMLYKVGSAVNKMINGINDKLRLHFEGVQIGWPINRTVAAFDWSPNLKQVSWGFIKRLAKGGSVAEGQRAIVGEHAPEYLRVVNGRAIVTPMTNQPARMGGDTTVNITINQQPGQSAEDLAAAVKRVFTRELQQREAAYA